MSSSRLLGGVLTHLSAENGLYARETFLSLYSCITRIFREHRLKGIVLTRIPEKDPDFEAMAMALESVGDIAFHRLTYHPEEKVAHTHIPAVGRGETGLIAPVGFLVALTDRFCAALYWSEGSQDTFRLYTGGWTFHPADAKTLALTLAAQALEDDPANSAQEDTTLHRRMLLNAIQNTKVDRRYDDKLNLLVTSLVNGLESRNRELTLALDQLKDLDRRMLDTERMAAIGQLCSVIAHEIRNPLGLIELYAKLIETQIERLTLTHPEEERPPLEKNIRLISEATQSLERILSELTDYSRPLQLHRSEVNLIHWVEEVCDFMRPSFDAKQVTLTVETVPGANPEDWVLLVDAPRLRQALINLLKNALEATVEAMSPEITPLVDLPTVTVTLAGRLGDEKRLIKVTDQGKGVPDALTEKLFTPYFSTKGNGTGLGLAHSRKILQAHNGSVALLNSSDHGATFAIILPAQ